MPLKKVLIITYYWPPSGGAGVQRWLKFVKYLKEFGWEPIVYTSEGGEVPILDYSLEKDIPSGTEVIKMPIWEPYSVYKKFVGQKKEQKINAGFLTEGKKNRFTDKIAVWIRGNFFIPDARKFWIKPSIKFLSEYLKNNKVDVIISSGPPHSMHLIALGLKKKFSIPWVADFRDPWTEIDYYDQLLLTSWADSKHKQLEKEVLQKANSIVVVGSDMAEKFKKLGAKNVSVITNGYDEADFVSPELPDEMEFSLCHIGSINKDRNPEVLWRVLEEIMVEDSLFKEKLKIRFIGKVDLSVLESINKFNLSNNLNKVDYLPHNEAVKQLSKNQILLLLLNDTPNIKGILTGKLFEYLAAKRPVLCIGTKVGDAPQVLKETNAGESFDYSDEKLIKKYILDSFEKFKSHSLCIKSENTILYSRRKLTEQLSILLNSIVK